MATLSVTEITLAGAAVSLTSASASGDQFANSGENVFLIVTNAHSASARTVTITRQAQSDYEEAYNIAATNPTVSVAAGATKYIGPFKKRWFNNSNNRVEVTYSDSAANLTVAAVKLDDGK